MRNLLTIPAGSLLTTGLQPGDELVLRPPTGLHKGDLVARKADGILVVAPYDVHDGGEFLGVVVGIRRPFPALP